ncbi:hypothetical protein ACQ4LE_010691 [Meloidogyne hapla]
MADMLCCTCNTPTSGAHLCKICQKPCHAIEPCAISCGEEGFGTNVICSDCFLDIEDVEEVSKNNEDKFFEQELNCEDENGTNPRKRRAYTINEKIEILDFSKKTSIHAASKHFKIDRNTVRDWKKQESDLRTMYELFN